MATDLLKVTNATPTPFIVIVPQSEFNARLLQTQFFNNRFIIVPDNNEKA